MAPMTRTNITLDDHTIKLIAHISDSTGASKSEIIRRGVVAYALQLTMQPLITGWSPAINPAKKKKNPNARKRG